MRKVAWDSWMAVTTSIRSLFISTISADSMATSVPAPMASPTSAIASAGRVVDAISHHSHPFSFFLQVSDYLGLILRHHLCYNPIHAHLAAKASAVR